MRWGRVALILVVLHATRAVAGGLKPPPSPDPAYIRRILDHDRGSGMVIIQQWQGIEAAFGHGLEGTMVTVTDRLVRRRKDLEDASMVYTSESPRRRTRDFRVDIIRNSTVTHLKQGDLTWHRMTSRHDGVVVLDGTLAYALVPGVMVGDRVRVVKKMEFHDVPGLPVILLGRHDTPCLDSSCEVRLPKAFTLMWAGDGSRFDRAHLVHESHADGSRQVHRWELRVSGADTLPVCGDQYPSFLVVPHIAAAGGRRGMAVGADWQAVGAAYLERIEDVFSPDKAIEGLADRLTTGVNDPGEKIDRIYSAVQERCRYLGLFEGDEGIIPKPASEVLASGFGDCKGLGTLLISLLRAAGFAAYPVLVKTGSSGVLVTSVPNMAQFNHFIAMVETEKGRVFLDGTRNFCPAGLVPVEDAVSPVLLLKSEEIGPIRIPVQARDPGTRIVTVEGTLDDSGRLSLESRYQLTGNLGVDWRNGLQQHLGSDRNIFLRRVLLARDPHFDTEEPQLEGMNNRQKPLVMRITGRTASSLPADDHGLYFPRHLCGATLGYSFKVSCEDVLDLRKYPGLHEEWAIALPPGLHLAGSDTLVVDGPGIHCRVMAWQDKGTLRFLREFQVRGDTMTVEQAGRVRKDMDNLRKADQGYLVLERR